LLFEERSASGISEMINGVYNKNKSIASDCLAVLYHIGYLDPSLIVEYYTVFLSLLNSKINRMVWGAMIAISTISKSNPELVYNDINLIEKLISEGTLITQIWGVNTLVNLCMNDMYYEEIIVKLLELLKICRNIDFAKRAQIINEVIQDIDKEYFINILLDRQSVLTRNSFKIIEKIVKDYNNKNS
jgi:hypothetical protein